MVELVVGESAKCVVVLVEGRGRKFVRLAHN